MKDLLGSFLNLLQCSTGEEIADWNDVDFSFAEKVHQQQPEDDWNCGIFVLLMMELMLENMDLCFAQFPFKLEDMYQVRKRLIYNIKKFNIPRTSSIHAPRQGGRTPHCWPGEV